MKKQKIWIYYLLICALALGSLHFQDADRTRRMGDVEIPRFQRNTANIDYSGLGFSPWDTASAALHVPKQEKRSYTIMVFMNGSDLESETGAATADLREMCDSGLDFRLVNLLIFTGGANHWQNDKISAAECALWQITEGGLTKICGVGLLNMGDPGTLAGFIDFSIANFPAERFGLILWDHGGGSIAGYGHDEKFQGSTLSLLELEYAFSHCALAENKLSFLGLDACLMATVEMAVVAAPYAKFLVASEDLEPGDGWNYRFLSVLNARPDMGGGDLGAHIAAYFIDYYGKHSLENLSLSVTDLSKAGLVMGALDGLMAACSMDLLENQRLAFRQFSVRRNKTRSFGRSSPRDEDCDMVDVGDLANRLYDLYPNEAAAIFAALDQAVLHNRHNAFSGVSGLSVFYLFGGKADAENSLALYRALSMGESYTAYLHRFASLLTGDPSAIATEGEEQALSHELTVWKNFKGQADQFAMVGIRYRTQSFKENLLWPEIGGAEVCLFEIDASPEKQLFAVPALCNGQEVELVVLQCEKFPDGEILGLRREDGAILQKGFDPIKIGDSLAFYYKIRALDGDPQETNWQLGEAFTVESELCVTWRPLSAEGGYRYGILRRDMQNAETLSSLALLD